MDVCREGSWPSSWRSWPSGRRALTRLAWATGSGTCDSTLSTEVTKDVGKCHWNNGTTLEPTGETME